MIKDVDHRMKVFNENRKIPSVVREKNALPVIEYPKMIRSFRASLKGRAKKKRRKKTNRAISTSKLDRCVSEISEGNSMFSYYKKGKRHVVKSR